MKELPAPAQRAVGCRTWEANGSTMQLPKALKDPRGQLPGRARQTRLDWWAAMTQDVVRERCCGFVAATAPKGAHARNWPSSLSATTTWHSSDDHPWVHCRNHLQSAGCPSTQQPRFRLPMAASVVSPSARDDGPFQCILHSTPDTHAHQTHAF